MADQDQDELLPAARQSSPTLPPSIPTSGINGNPQAARLITSVAQSLSSNPQVAEFNLSVNNTTGAVNVAMTSKNGVVGTYDNPTPGLVRTTTYTPSTPEAQKMAIEAMRSPTTQVEAARAVGSSQPTVSRLENNPPA